MMWATINWIYWGILYTGLDIVVYVFVDILAKTPLKDARDEHEKRQVWLLEAGLLLFLSFLFWLFHHPPVMLFLLAALTLLYTQLLGRVNFRCLWLQLSTKWEEFQQHEESIRKLQEMNIHAANPMPPSKHWPIPVQVPAPVPFDPGRSDIGPPPPAEAWYPAQSPSSEQTTSPRAAPSVPRYRGHIVQHSCDSGGTPYNRLPGYMVSNHHPSSYMVTNSHQHSQVPVTAKYTPVVSRRTDLARPSLHPHLESPRLPTSGLSFKSKVMSVLGLNPFTALPPGLRNDGDNLCFLNSVLQCLAHSPGLVKCLRQAQPQHQCPPVGCSFLEAVTEILDLLAVRPGTTDVHVVDTTRLRQAASEMPESLISSPSSPIPQTQQDAAEVLMWLLGALHTTLNTSNQANNGGSGQLPRHPGSPRYTYLTLNMLSFIYGDLNPQRVAESKAACRREIEQANGLDNESYAEPVQRLSDLEWLTYKEQNNSAVDDLFTGQLVEAQHCLACNRISVGIQTFTILPVPVVEPRHFNGLVYLEDCFTKFGNVEDLFGPDGLRCECSNSRPSQPHVPSTPVKHGSPIMHNGGGGRLHITTDKHRLRFLGSDSGVQITMNSTPMSPIISVPGHEVFHDSGFQDHQFKTSTPINTGGGSQRPGLPVRLTDSQRRSLLRQLPECLVVQLLRFSYQQGAPRKLEQAVSIPLSGLDLTHLVADNVMRREDLTALNACFVYDLCGLCLHLGGQATSHGHYLSYCKAADGLWYKFDDSKVTAVNMAYELSTKMVRENAYLLFYQKSF